MSCDGDLLTVSSHYVGVENDREVLPLHFWVVIFSNAYETLLAEFSTPEHVDCATFAWKTDAGARAHSHITNVAISLQNTQYNYYTTTKDMTYP